MATLFSVLLLSLLVLTIPTPSSSSSQLHSHLNKRSSLSVEHPDHILISPNGTFAAGFHPVGNNAYSFAIWFADPSCGPANCTIVWTANRDIPINGKRSKLSLLKTGNLVLKDADRSIVWETRTESPLSLSLRLLDSGNLVLVSEKGDSLWESFASPTDTLLPGQPLTRHTTLVASRSRSNFSSGFYKLSFDEQNVLVLFYEGLDTSSAFWPVDHSLLPRDVGRASYNSSRIAVLDNFGKFTSSDNFSFVSADYGAIIQRKVTLDFDGNLRLYSRENGRGSNWVMSYQAISDACQIHGSCGPNSVCTYLPSLDRKTCSCFPGFRRKNSTDLSLGCEPEFNIACADGKTVDDVTYLPFQNVESKGYDFGFYDNTTLAECEQICTNRCDCKGFVIKFFYRNSPDNIPYCFPKTQLLNGFKVPNFRGVLYLKMPKSNSNLSTTIHVPAASLSCPAEGLGLSLHRKYGSSQNILSLFILLWFVSGVGVIEILAMAFVWFRLIVTHQKKDETDQVFLLADTGFKRFTYRELRRATRNFKEEIGRGASGIVYKGVLSNNRVAAIKKLYESEHGEAEFLAEASAIGGLNHMHLIEMWGYCAEGKHRILVYEYMEHGSLAENLSSNAIDGKKRFDIAVGTAKGLAYLHEECLEWVLHCDLKPQNILLDSEYQPKVSDFGLSKLLNRGGPDNSSFSRMRGTRGYMAPEWVYRLKITSKVDVYSYGVVVLEMVTGKNPTAETGEGARLVDWVREKKKNGGTDEKCWVEEVVDPMIACNCEMKKMELMVNVALECVEEDMNARPSMRQVVEMLLSHKR